ncbi:MAG: PqqD family peptide modification chaperone [Gemmatimonadales bacterium]
MGRTEWIEPTTVVSRNEEPVAVEVDRTVVMLSIAQGMYYGMEGVGRRIWALLETPRTVASLCDRLMEEFEVDRADCEADVREFLEQLRQSSLIRVHDVPPDSTDAPAGG